jgi:hypothetical protein
MRTAIMISVLFLVAVPANSQFTAKMHFTSMGQDRVFTVFSADAGYRYEFNENNMDGAIIVKTGSPEIIILMPQQKMAMKGSATDPMSMGNDPVAAYKYYQDEGIIKVEGKEIINGINCTRSGLWNRDNPDQKMFTVWTSDDYNMPVKLINHISGSDDTTMEMKEIEPWTPNAQSFEIPAGYQVMDIPKMIP